MCVDLKKAYKRVVVAINKLDYLSKVKVWKKWTDWVKRQ